MTTHPINTVAGDTVPVVTLLFYLFFNIGGD